MEILTLPVGLVIGLFPVLVDLGPQGGVAHLRLDHRTVCEVSVAAPGCMVDLGPLPRVHSLELERVDAAGRPGESIRRYLNRGISGSIRAVGACDDRSGTCDFTLQWAHPAKEDPVSIAVEVDGRRITSAGQRILFPNLRSAPPQVLSVEAVFPDGGRATTRDFSTAPMPRMPKRGCGTWRSRQTARRRERSSSRACAAPGGTSEPSSRVWSRSSS